MKAIVITTVNEPTAAVRAFSALADYEVFVVGDLKTPVSWTHPRTRFISVDEQTDSGSALASALPFNHYSRKMLGYVQAIEAGAHLIIDTDDDNIPKHGYGFPDLCGEFESTSRDQGFVNPYAFFTDQRIWPRGLPLDQVAQDDSNLHLIRRHCNVGVWQGLADGDPDVDAIYRLTDDTPCIFRDRSPVVLATGTMAPFNSQNTMIRRDLFPLLYLPASVTFRFTDILRGLVAQPIMWLHGFELGFSSASVTQVRNPHDYFQDFLSEIPMYQHSRDVPEIVTGSLEPSAGIIDNLWHAYGALVRERVVPKAELEILRPWLDFFGDEGPQLRASRRGREAC